MSKKPEDKTKMERCQHFLAMGEALRRDEELARRFVQTLMDGYRVDKARVVAVFRVDDLVCIRCKAVVQGRTMEVPVIFEA